MSRNGSAYHRLLNTSRWRELRARQLSCHPLCEDCMKMGLIIPATEVHHVVPVESAGDRERMTRLAYDPGNLVSLCPTCHTERHRQLRSHSASEKGGGGFLAQGRERGRDFLRPPGSLHIHPPSFFHARRFFKLTGGLDKI